MTAGVAPLLLVDDDGAYWAHYVRSLATGTGLPVRTSHPALTASVLEAAGLPASRARAADRPGAHAGELARLHAGRDLGRVTGLLAALRELAGPRPDATGQWIVGAGGGVALGLARAAAQGRPFLAVETLADPRIAALAEHAQSLYIVTDRADPDAMARLVREAGSRATAEPLPGVRACPVGFLHGRDFEAMTLLDAKQRRPVTGSGPDVLLDSTVSAAPADAGDDLVTVPYRQADRDTIGRLEHIRLLAISSHGMSDQVHLNGDYLCGRSPYADVAGPLDPRLPSCTMAGGGFCYFKPDGRPLPAHRVRAEHVFVNSCGSLSFEETDFNPLFAIWYAALDGRARSFVGTIRWKDGHGLEALLYRNLLRSGRSLGEAVCLLNRALPGNQLEGGDVYFLLGDPADRLVERQPSRRSARLRRGRNVVDLSGGLACTTATSPELVSAIGQAGLQVRAEIEDLQVSTIPAGGGAVHVLLFTGRRVGLDLGSVAVDVGDFRHEHATMLAVSDALEQTLAPVLGMHGLYPDQVRQGGRKNLEGRLLQLSRLYKARFTDPAAAGRLVRTTRTLLRELDRTDEHIARWLQERIRTTSYRFSEHYQDNFLLAGTDVGPGCYQCGRATTRRELRHILRPGIRRTEFICPRCGSIADTPDPAVSLLIDLPETVVRGEKATVSVRLDNRSGHERRGYCLAAVRRSATAGIEQTDAVHALTVPAGAGESVGFDLVVADGAPVHQYDLQAAFVSTTRIYLGRRAFWITDARGVR